SNSTPTKSRFPPIWPDPAMPKKILFESACHQFLWAGRRLRHRFEDRGNTAAVQRLSGWLNSLELINPGRGELLVRWSGPVGGEHTVALKGAKFYTRGDAEAHYKRQSESGLTFAPDAVMAANRSFFDAEMHSVLL